MRRFMLLSVASIAVVLLASERTAWSQPAAEIDILAIGPRTVDQDPADLFDIRSSGLHVVGVGDTVYLAPLPDSAFVSRISDYDWNITTFPTGHPATIDSETSSMLKMRPVYKGEYVVELTPTVDGSPSTPTTQRIYAAEFVGTGTEGSNTPVPPNCGFSACHGASAQERLMKVAEWQGTKHAHMLESFLNGTRGSFYSVSCLECHTLGYSDAGTEDDNFYEISQDLTFDLNQIPTWVADAASTTGSPHWTDLPAPLQLKSNIQCESCHGPGSGHNGDRTKIAGPQFDAKQCFQCHDAPPHHPHVQQWLNSHHPHTISSDSHRTNATCQPCHTTEGFAFVRGEGEPGIPPEVESRNSLDCVGCHDPHSRSNEHQLRTIDPVTLPDGTVFDGGLGNTCANCHHVRYVAADRVGQSRHGAHHGPQSDVIMGTGAYDWGVPYPYGPSTHASVVTNTCVDCHMAENTSDTLTPILGGHTWAINAGGYSNAEEACGGCHLGLTTTDRMPLVPVDYDGDGYTSGIQTEVGNLLENVKNAILANLPGTSWDDEEEAISISSTDYDRLTFNMQGALYNFNVCSEDRSEGVHNTKYVVAVLQRAYRFATGHRYAEDYPLAMILDNYTPVRPTMWRQYR